MAIERNNRILIIDDNEDIHKAFKAILRTDVPVDREAAESFLRENELSTLPLSFDFQIDYAFQGEDGWKMVERASQSSMPYALAFVDMRMPPGWDGMETIEKIWSTDPMIQVVICTAYSDHSWDEVVRRVGESDQLLILKKPFEPFDVRQFALALTNKWWLTRQAELRMNVLREMVHDRTSELVAAKNELSRTVTDLRLQRSRAETANQTKCEFLANMSHEIRTPITAMLGFSELLLVQDDLEPVQRIDAFRTIQRNGQYLLEIINDILDISKLECGKLDVERIKCSPGKVLADVATLMRVRASAKGLPLEIQYAGPIPETIQCDPTRLRQILINLVANAIKFTEVGEIRVVVRLLTEQSGEPKLQFDVIDTGIGMAESQLDRLFQPFVQADMSSTRKFGGTGLGLTISKRLAEMLDGTIQVKSTPGEGSTFSATVAIGSLDGVVMVDAPTEEEEEPSMEQAMGCFPQDCHILLAEDGPDNQRLIMFILKKAGANVTIVENGQLALELALSERDKGTPFDVILMDMQMPVLDGYQATSQLREAGYAGPIIALTAHAMSSDRDKCLHAGCDDYTTKPIDRESLISLVGQFARQQDAKTVVDSQA